MMIPRNKGILNILLDIFQLIQIQHIFMSNDVELDFNELRGILVYSRKTT